MFFCKSNNMISDSLVVSIKAFMDATSLVQKPEYTWLQRNLILRILYGIRGIDINSCVKNLEDSGLFIGLYNVIGTENHLLYKLHAMDLSDWIRLVTSINTECIDTIFTELRMFYGHDLETSPLWDMKKTFEESQIEYVDDPNLLLHVCTCWRYGLRMSSCTEHCHQRWMVLCLTLPASHWS